MSSRSLCGTEQTLEVAEEETSSTASPTLPFAATILPYRPLRWWTRLLMA